MVKELEQIFLYRRYSELAQTLDILLQTHSPPFSTLTPEADPGRPHHQPPRLCLLVGLVGGTSRTWRERNIRLEFLFPGSLPWASLIIHTKHKYITNTNPGPNSGPVRKCEGGKQEQKRVTACWVIWAIRPTTSSRGPQVLESWSQALGGRVTCLRLHSQ